MAEVKLTDKIIHVIQVLQDIVSRETTDANEREVAAERLAALLKKHGITLEDLNVDKPRPCKYYIAPRHHELFFAIIWNVKANWDGWYKIGTYDRKSKGIDWITIDLTVAEEIEVTAKFDFYAKDYDRQFKDFCRNLSKQKQIFARAYVTSQNIDVNPATTIDDSNVRKTSIEDIRIIVELAQKIERKPFAKQLQQSNN